MTRYIVKLSEQEDLELRKLALQPGFEVIFKFLQIESLSAQTAAMECTGTQEQRLLALTDAQRTAHIVSSLTQRLASYQNEIQAPSAENHAIDIIENIWNETERTN